MAHRNYCFTLNNYTDEEYDQLINYTYKYLIIGKEIAASGTHHLQGYIEFDNPKKLATLKNFNKNIHWEARKGTQEQAVKYCKKENNFIEKGTKANQGQRNDLKEIKDDILKGTTMRKLLIDDKINNYQQLKYAEGLNKYLEPVRTWKPFVQWFHGPSGSGKSRKAFELYPDAWTSGRNLRWFEGYDGHENVIFDDFREEDCTLTELLKLLDRYPYRIETKGSSRQFLAKNIIITCPKPPEHLIYYGEEKDQLIRRIDEIKQFPLVNTVDTEVGGNTKPQLRAKIELDRSDNIFIE